MQKATDFVGGQELKFIVRLLLRDVAHVSLGFMSRR